MKFSWKRFKFNKDWWKTNSLLVRLVNWAKTSTFIGFHGVPVYDVLKFIYKESLDDDLTTRANSMAFSFFLALFPSIIFLFTLLPHIPLAADYALDIRESVNGLLPPSSEDFVFGLVDDIVSRQRGGLLSFGLLLAIFFSSNGMIAMMRGFEKAHATSTFKKRNWLRKRLTAILLTVIIVFIFIISSGLIVLGQVFINLLKDWTNLDAYAVWGFSALRWLCVIMLIYFSVAVLYRYGPATKKRFHIFSLGTTIASFLIISSSLAFSYFVTNFGKYNELYGSIGALIVTLVWFNIICFILLVGFELNASIAVNRDLNKTILRDSNNDITVPRKL